MGVRFPIQWARKTEEQLSKWQYANLRAAATTLEQLGYWELGSQVRNIALASIPSQSKTERETQ